MSSSLIKSSDEFSDTSSCVETVDEAELSTFHASCTQITSPSISAQKDLVSSQDSMLKGVAERCEKLSRTKYSSSYEMSNAPPRRLRACYSELQFANTDHVFETKEHSRMLNVLKRREFHGSPEVNDKKGSIARCERTHRTERENALSVLPLTFTKHHLLHSGSLQKQGSWRRNWKLRYFMLRDDYPCLCYYKSRVKFDLLGYIRITRDTFVLDRTIKTEQGISEFLFQVRGGTRNLSLKAETSEMLTQWVSCIQKLVDNLREAHFHPRVILAKDLLTVKKEMAKVVDGADNVKKKGYMSDELIEDIGATESGPDYDGFSSMDESDNGCEKMQRNRIGKSRIRVAEEGECKYNNKTVCHAGISDSDVNHVRQIYIDVLLNQHSELLRAEHRNEKAACFVKISGITKATNRLAQIGVTDPVRLSSAQAITLGSLEGIIEAGFSESMRVYLLSFSIVFVCDLRDYRDIRVTLLRCAMNQSSDTFQLCIGTGKVSAYDKSMLVIPIKENSSRAINAANKQFGKTLRADFDSKTFDTHMAHVFLHSFAAKSILNTLPAFDADMAYRRYRFTAFAKNLAREGSEVEKVAPMAGARESIKQINYNCGLNGLRYTDDLWGCSVEEIMRAPRSTFSLPVAYLDYLENKTLERKRFLRDQMKFERSKLVDTQTLLSHELAFYEEKEKEYVRHRQFLLKQEKYLLEEIASRNLFTHISNLDDAIKASKRGAKKPFIPFKQSVYRNLEEWQFVSTNMQHQFLHVYNQQSHEKEGAESKNCLVWHTMTMGCPAAHFKGFSVNVNWSEELDHPVVLRSARTFILSSTNGSTDDAECSNRNQRSRTQTLYSEPVTTKLTPEESMSELKHRLDINERLQIVSSQILSAAVACILASLDLASQGSQYHQAQFLNACSFGYLISFESLLSTKGKEIGMLEDFFAASKWLRSVSVCFRKHHAQENTFSIRDHVDSHGCDIHNSETQDCKSSQIADGICRPILLTIGIPVQLMDILSPDLVEGTPFRLRCVLFTQGINENQSIVNTLKSSAVKLQDRINHQSLLELRHLYTRFRRSCESRTSTRPNKCNVQWFHTMDMLLNRIEKHLSSSSNHYKKNFELLIDSSDFCRELGAARVTCCKSGKDRTAMSVTMEQTRICEKELHALDPPILCHNMRLFGVRRNNVFMNTGIAKYAFNEMQRKLLPDCYKPPVGTYKSGKT